jgi:CheY-like chemotaxis protein
MTVSQLTISEPGTTMNSPSLHPTTTLNPISPNRMDLGPVGTVLVADGMAVSAKLLDHVLSGPDCRCRCVVVRDGAEALRCIMSEVKFDLIFLDWRLPTVDGPNVLRMIQSTSNCNQHTHIIGISMQPENQTDGSIEDWIARPVTVEAVMRLHDKYLANKAR